MEVGVWSRSGEEEEEVLEVMNGCDFLPIF